jgi:hypothetical protein
LLRVLGLACAAALTASCTDRMPGDPDGRGGGSLDAVPTDVDPIGTWDMSYQYSASCARPPVVESSTLRVTQGDDGYAVIAAGATMASTLTCAPDGCKLSGMFAWSVTSVRFEQTVNIALDASDHLTGHGTELIVEGTNTCNMTFAVDGVKL